MRISSLRPWRQRAAQLSLLLAGIWGLSQSASAVNEDELLPVEEAFVLSAKALSADEVAFQFSIADGYYLYKHRLSVQALDEGTLADTLILPSGKAMTDEFFGEVETYRDSVTALLPGISGPGGEQRFRIRYQGCADIGICYPPQSREVTVNLPLTPSLPFANSPHAGGLLAGLSNGSQQGTASGSDTLPLPAEEAFQFEAITTSPVELLLRFTPAPGYYLYRDRSEFRLIDSEGVQLTSPQWPQGQAHNDEHFGDVVVYFDQIEVPLGLRRTQADSGQITLEANFQGCQTDGICYPPMIRTITLNLPEANPEQLLSELPAEADTRTTKAPSLSWVMAIALAIGGGLILNLMPCVLPVLSLKVLSLAQSGESRSHARNHALWYTAGVLLSFGLLGALAIALRHAGLSLGWGFQLQQPLVVAGLAYLMVAVGLSLSGVFSIGSSWTGIGNNLASKSGPAGDFFTGVLAVVVASPCTAPLMGPALGFAFASHPALALLVFLALGLGLALPFLLIGFVPSLAAYLPRPGAWMNTLKQVLAFPMYLTAVWLLWVLGQQRGVDALGLALVGIVVMALALWRWEAARWNTGLFAKVFALVLLAIALIPLTRIPQLPVESAVITGQSDSVAYSKDALDALRADGRTVFINMTADWCVTCKANEKRVLDTDGFRDLLAQYNAVYMKGDWTNVDPAITEFLESHGSVGVPLYVVARPSHDDVVLPTVLSLGAVKSALESK